MLSTRKPTARTCLALAFWILLPTACTSMEPQDSGQLRSPTGEEGSETVVIRPQQPLIAQHAEVTVSLSFDRERRLRKIAVEPETAVIFYRPSDERLVTQVLWRVECLIEGKLGSCPDRAFDAVVISRKEGCPDLFGTEAFKIDEGNTAIASGRVKDVYDRHMKRYQEGLKAMMEKDDSFSDSLLSCRGERLRPALATIDPYQGITWQYNVTVHLANGQTQGLDPEIWVEKDEGG